MSVQRDPERRHPARPASTFLLAVATTLGVGCAGSSGSADPGGWAMFNSPLLSGRSDGFEGSQAPEPSNADRPPSDEAASPADTDAEDGAESGAAGPEAASSPAASPNQRGASTAEPPASGAEPPPEQRREHALAYALAMMEANDVSVPQESRSSITALYRHCREREVTFRRRPPAAGDLVFFHNTADLDGDGRNDDWYSFVGLVEQVDSDETVHLLGYRDGSVEKYALNLQHAKTPSRDGRQLNSQLRTPRPGDPEYTQYHAGQLFAGYCSLMGDRSKFYVLDDWEPGMEVSPPSATAN